MTCGSLRSGEVVVQAKRMTREGCPLSCSDRRSTLPYKVVEAGRVESGSWGEEKVRKSVGDGDRRGYMKSSKVQASRRSQVRQQRRRQKKRLQGE